VTQERLNNILAAAAEAARAHPDWRDGDQLVIILADESTVLHSWGFGMGELAQLLEFHAGKLRQAEPA